MIKYAALVLAAVFSFSNCFADTFVHRFTGETFDGYATCMKKGELTQVRIEGRAPEYVNLDDYQVQRNYLGRKNKVFVLLIKEPIELICETEAFEKAIVLAANQGPLFILIEIDTPGGQVDLTQRLCTAITKMDNCDTVAFVSGDKFGGAFSAGVIVALACNKVYMQKGTAIGAAAPYVRTTLGPEEIGEVYGQTVAEKFNSAWLGYCAAIAERNNRPSLLVKAMVDEDIEVLEVVEDGRHLFITTGDKKPKQTVVHTWSRKGSLLTLTAAEASRTGIADKEMISRTDVFVELEATEAAQVQDSSISEARRDFEKARRKLDEVLSSISYLENQAAAITAAIGTVEQQISQFSGAVYDERYGRYWLPTPALDVDQWERMLLNHDNLLDELMDVSAALIRGYNKAIPMAQGHPDLAHHVDNLRNSLEIATATYTQVRSRPRYFY